MRKRSALLAGGASLFSLIALTPALADGGKGGTGLIGAVGFPGGTGFTGNPGGNSNTDGGPGGGGAGGGNGGNTNFGPGGGAGGTFDDPDGKDGGNEPGTGGGGGWNGNDPDAMPAGTGQSTLNNAGSLSGGKGGKGGNADFFMGGAGGGAGGYGAIVTGSGASTNTGMITGGAGGGGGTPGFSSGTTGGNGGDGGVGVQFTASGATLTNSGTIVGGNGGAGGAAAGAGSAGSSGAGGAGIVGAGLTVINSGSIMGGMNGDETTRADAVAFTGGTNLLELQAGSSITGNVVAFSADDTLVFGGTANASFDVSQIGASAQYQGFGSLEKTGLSTWTLIGTSTAAAPWTVEQGTLQVNGSIESSPLTTVESGGTLMGTGTLGALSVEDGGIHAPGNSIGTQFVVGPYMLDPGAILEVELDATPNHSDKVVVTGTVNITDAVLRVLAANGNYAPNTSYLIIDNDGVDPVTGTFAQVTTNLVFLAPTVAYNVGAGGNDVVLTLQRVAVFNSVAQTRNQSAVADALELFPTDNPLFLAVLNQTAAGARQAFDALSGEVHATVQGVLADDSRYLREAVLGRLKQATYTSTNAGQVAALGAGGPQVATLDSQAMALGYDDKSLAPPPSPSLAFWTRAFGAWGDFDGDGNAAAASRDLGGFLSGMDARVGGSWRIGLGAGGSWSDVSVAARHSAAEVESFHLAGYGGGMAGPFALRGGGAWSWNEIDSSRAVIFPGFFERETASYDADTGQIFGEAAYPIVMGRSALEPFAGLAYVAIDTGSFKENGAEAALASSGFDQDVGYSTLGLRAATTMGWNGVTVTPHVSAAWQHAFSDVDTAAALAFAATGIGFTVAGVPLAEDTALIEAGLDLAFAANVSAGISYAGQFGDGVADNGVKGRFTWLF